MNFSIRRWLVDNKIARTQLNQSVGGMASLAFQIVKYLEAQNLTLFDIGGLAEVLELPFPVAKTEIPFLSQLIEEILRALSQKKPLKRAEGTWLAFQIAYLNSLSQLLSQEELLQKPWLSRAHFPLWQTEGGSGEVPSLSHSPLTELLPSLYPETFNDTEAERTLSEIGSSTLIRQMNLVTSSWLVANGAEEKESQLLMQRLTHSLPGYLLLCVAQHPLALPQLQKFVRLGNTATWNEPLTDSEDYELLEAPPPLPAVSHPLPIDLPRERYRAQLSMALSQPFFEESFALPDLYVPLKGVAHSLGDASVTLQHETTNSSEPVEVMEWANAQLNDPATIAAIEAPAGQGKTGFCQIWAAQIATTVYPIWMPLLIELRNVRLGYRLEQTLASALPIANFTCADGWLSPVNPPCLIILDGLDELPRSPIAEDQISLLIDQLVKFQARYTNATGLPRHKIVLTYRTGTLGSKSETRFSASAQTLTSAHFRRLQIQPMGQEELKTWFRNWSTLQTKTLAQAYFNFLKSAGMFRPNPPAKEMAMLIRKPLMLYLVGILYRDGLLAEGIFQMPYPQVKFEIYDRLTTWLLGEPTAGLSASRSEDRPIRAGLAHAGRTREAIANLLQNTPPHQLRESLQQVAFRLWQTGRNQLDNTEVTASIQLPYLYFRNSPNRFLTSSHPPGNPTQTPVRIEFSHPCLGEYLTAEQIATELKRLAQIVLSSYGEHSFALNEPTQFAKRLYRLLGAGILSVELEELIIERLWREEARDPEAFNFRMLFTRLHSFYQSYCRGRWIDENIASEARQNLQSLQNPLHVLQIDAAVGLNVFILLCACHREANIAFWPCGYPKIKNRPKLERSYANPIFTDQVTGNPPTGLDDLVMEFNPSQLLVLAGRTAVLSPTLFWRRVRHSFKALSLGGAYLHRAMLAEGNLQQCNLEGAVLVEANLNSANLKAANLSWANLAGANLAGTNLAGTNLEGANLTGANLYDSHLQSANLTNACLFQAQLDEQSLAIARSKGAFFTLEPFLAYNQAIAFQNLKEERINTERGEDTSVLPIEIADEETTAIALEPPSPSPEPPLFTEEVTEAETIVYRQP